MDDRILGWECLHTRILCAYGILNLTQLEMNVSQNMFMNRCTLNLWSLAFESRFELHWNTGVNCTTKNKENFTVVCLYNSSVKKQGFLDQFEFFLDSLSKVKNPSLFGVIKIGQNTNTSIDSFSDAIPGAVKVFNLEKQSNPQNLWDHGSQKRFKSLNLQALYIP